MTAVCLPKCWSELNDWTLISISDVAGANEWLVMNIQEVGYFKVNYDKKNWEMLINQLQKDHTVIHSANRAQVRRLNG